MVVPTMNYLSLCNAVGTNAKSERVKKQSKLAASIGLSWLE
jgi:hypothetical protein